MKPLQPSSLHIFASAFGTDILYSSLPTLCIWNKIFRRSSGDTTVLETAPATPPATKDATTGCANVCRMRSRAVRSGARGCVDHVSWTLATASENTYTRILVSLRVHGCDSMRLWLCRRLCGTTSFPASAPNQRPLRQAARSLRKHNSTRGRRRYRCAMARSSVGGVPMEIWTAGWLARRKLLLVLRVDSFRVGAAIQSACIR
jgi:hypothetical protein